MSDELRNCPKCGCPIDVGRMTKRYKLHVLLSVMLLFFSLMLGLIGFYSYVVMGGVSVAAKITVLIGVVGFVIGVVWHVVAWWCYG